MSHEIVDVLFTAAGEPWKVKRAGRVWQVAVEPTRHFERVLWWRDTAFSVRKGQADRIDYVVWRVQVRLGANPRSDLLTWDLMERPQHSTWSVLDVV